MPHVEEGQLHALLDQQLPDAAAQHIRDHIRECAECRTRLEEAESVRMRATRLLGRAAPYAEMPPFETVLRRAPQAGGGSRFRIPGPARLAWAASIILALGIGWFGRDLAPFGVTPPREEAALSSAPAESPAPPSVSPQPEMARAIEPGAPSRGVQGAAAGEVSTAGRRDGRERAQAEADQAKPLTDQVAAQRYAADEAQRARASDLTRSAEAAAAKVAAAPPPPAAVQPTAAVAQKSIAALASAAIAWEFVTQQEAERRAGRPVMTIPGLEVVNVGVAVSGTGLLVRTTQRLADQNLIELVQEPVTVVAAAENRREAAGALAAPAPAQPGFTTDATGAVILMLQRGNVMLTGRAALPVDSLRALMQRATN